MYKENKHTPAKIFNFIAIELGVWVALAIVALIIKGLLWLFGLFL